MGWQRCGRARTLLREIAAAAFSRSYYTIQAVPREYTGSRLAARERALGRVPAVVVSQGDEDGAQGSRKLQITADRNQIVALLKRVPFFCSTKFVLQVRAGAGSSALLQSATVLPIKVQKKADTGEVLNLVLAWAEKDDSVKVDVPVVYKGEDDCPGLKKSGFLRKMRSGIKFLCPSERIPQKVEVDLSNLDIGDQVLVKDLQVDSSLQLVSKIEDMPVCKVAASKAKAGVVAGTESIDKGGF